MESEREKSAVRFENDAACDDDAGGGRGSRKRIAANERTTFLHSLSPVVALLFPSVSLLVHVTDVRQTSRCLGRLVVWKGSLHMRLKSPCDIVQFIIISVCVYVIIIRMT